MQEAIHNLTHALAYLDRARAPLAKREKTFHNRTLVKIVDYAGLHISSALTMLRDEEEGVMGEASFVVRNFPCCFAAGVMLMALLLAYLVRKVWPK